MLLTTERTVTVAFPERAAFPVFACSFGALLIE